MPATSQSQQRLFGVIRAYQKDRSLNVSAKIKDLASSIKPKIVREFAATPHTGLPEKKSMTESEKLAAEVEKSAAFLGGVYASVMDADPAEQCATMRGARQWLLNGGIEKAAAVIKPMQPIQPAQFSPPMGSQTQQQGSLLPNAPAPLSQVPVPPTPPVGRYDFRNDPAVLGMQSRVRESIQKKLSEADKLRYQASPQAAAPPLGTAMPQPQTSLVPSAA